MYPNLSEKVSCLFLEANWGIRIGWNASFKWFMQLCFTVSVQKTMRNTCLTVLLLTLYTRIGYCHIFVILGNATKSFVGFEAPVEVCWPKQLWKYFTTTVSHLKNMSYCVWQQSPWLNKICPLRLEQHWISWVLVCCGFHLRDPSCPCALLCVALLFWANVIMHCC